MSEASEKVAGIRHLPLFPLPLVLLPNELLPLHIFEPRYRQMLKDVGLEKNLFGVIYFNQEESLAGKPPVDTVGCAAEVRELQSLPDGRSNILSVGVIRYRLLDYVDSGRLCSGRRPDGSVARDDVRPPRCDGRVVARHRGARDLSVG